MALYSLIKPAGILTFVMLITTATSGLLKWRIRLHKTFAITTLILAAMHAELVLTA